MKNYDLRLPQWGPYNKKYLGISNIADYDRGVRFELSLFPGVFRRSVMQTKAVCDCGAKIMKSSSDASHYLYRYELEWKDRVYLDADFLVSDNGDVQIKCNFVNNTDSPESLSLNACASVKFPSFKWMDLKPYEVRGSSRWIDAADYSDISCLETVGKDGMRKGEIFASGFVGGRCVSGENFSSGHITYTFPKKAADEVHFRYSAKNDVPITFKAGGRTYSAILPATEEVLIYTVKTEKAELSDIKLYLENGEYKLDGIIIGENKLDFICYADDFIPEIKNGDKTITLDYTFGSYEISWNHDDFVIREIFGENVGETLEDKVHDHVGTSLQGLGDGHYTDIFLRPIFVDAHSEKTVTLNLRRLDKEQKSDVSSSFVTVLCNSDGDKYKLSQSIMQATTLTNIVFPVYIKGGYIRHNTPGRFWDCLYTWDSGFIGMGLNTLDKTRATDCLNTYLTEPGDEHSPFIFHGSLVPTQIFLYQELWNKYRDIELLERFFPSMEQYYEFFSSRTKTETGLAKLWDMFYNSGGWDDYPPQFYVNENRLTDCVYPVITAAATVLCAKILRNIAIKLRRDSSKYDADIERISRAIQTHCQDEETGYFGYVKKDEHGTSILKYNDEINYNMGFDGVYPFIADICTPEQEKRILENIENGLMTEYGMSVVDTRAPYFCKSGYWNGSVWMPHQWILWKSLLDHGKEELSTRIAKTALDTFSKEVNLTYNCYEHFMLANGRGAGFHQFSGLSTPVLMWFDAYFKPGTVNVGFTSFIDKANWNDDFTSLSLDITATSENAIALVCMNEKYDYSFTLNGKKVDGKKITNGAYAVKLSEGKLQVSPKNV